MVHVEKPRTGLMLSCQTAPKLYLSMALIPTQWMHVVSGVPKRMSAGSGPVPTVRL